jgi:adenylate cyclase
MRFTFRFTLIAALTVLLTGTVAVVGAVSYVNGRANAEELSRQVLEQTARRIDVWIDGLLSTARTQNELNRRLLLAGTWPLDDFTPLGSYWVDAMRTHAALSFLSVGLEGTGDMLAVERRPDGELSIRELRRGGPGGPLALADYRPADYARRVPYATKPDHEAGNPTRRGWYLAAAAAGRSIWTETYTFLGEGGSESITGVTYATPVRREDGSQLGVLTADYDVLAVSRYLASTPVGRAGLAFVVETRRDGTRRVIAHPSPRILTRRAAATADGAAPIELVPAAELADERVCGFLEAAGWSGATAPGGELRVLRFRADGADWVGAWFPLAGDDVPPWTVCLALPEVEVMGRVTRNNRIALAIGACAFAVALLAGVWLSTRISRPLRRLAEQAAAVGRFELDPAGLERSRIREIDRLVTATEDMKAGLRSFGKFVPTDLVREILASGQEARLGARRETLTVLFSDIAGFTTISEQLEPEVLAEHLGEYLEEMSRIVQQERGTVGRYIGDAILGFWGAPRPDAEHALDACRAALRSQARLGELRERWRAEGRPEFRSRIGVNTGRMVVGNMGSTSRLDYTVYGDDVNLASRLEGLNKFYGTAILIGENTRQLAGERVVVREVDRVAVKGKAQPVRVYELLGLRGETTTELERLARDYGAALELFRARRWDDAARALEALLAAVPGDGPSQALLERCRELAAAPPPPDWDGVRRMEEK